jgi:hypothetical protein
MAPNCKIPSSLFIGDGNHMTLPDTTMLFFQVEVLHKSFPGEVFDEWIEPFTCKRAVGIWYVKSSTDGVVTHQVFRYILQHRSLVQDLHHARLLSCLSHDLSSDLDAYQDGRHL